MQDEIKFFGTDIIRYYWFLIKNSFADSSWQITISYTLVLICIVAILCVTGNFISKHRKREKQKKISAEIKEKYGEIVRELITDQSKTKIDVYEAFDQDVKHNAKYFIDLIIDVRNSLHEISYIPNIQHVCDATGVTEYVEYNLLKGIDVFETMNNVLMIQLKVSDGRLSNYVNHKNVDIRTFARIAYMICVDKEPYKYLYDLLNDKDSDYICLLIHYTLKWLKVQNVVMPNFQNLIEHTNNEHFCGFIINELPELIDDKTELYQLLDKYVNDKSDIKKIASINTLTDLNYSDETMCDKLLNMFINEIYDVQYAILNNMLKVSYNNNETLSKFFEFVYREAIDNTFRDIALRGLYKYDINKFYELMQMYRENNFGILFDVIDEENKLKLMRTLQ